MGEGICREDRMRGERDRDNEGVRSHDEGKEEERERGKMNIEKAISLIPYTERKRAEKRKEKVRGGKIGMLENKRVHGGDRMKRGSEERIDGKHI